MPTKTLSAEELARLAKEKADEKTSAEESRARASQIRRLQNQIIQARTLSELVRRADANNDKLNKQFLRAYEKLPRTFAELKIRRIAAPMGLVQQAFSLHEAKTAMDKMYASRALGAGISASMGGISKAAAMQQAMLGKGISTAFGEIGQAARAKEALGKGISRLFEEIGKAAGKEHNAIGKGMSNLFGGISKAAMLQKNATDKGLDNLFKGITKAAVLQKTAMDKGLNNLFKGIGQAAVAQQKQSAALGTGISRSMAQISRAAALQQAQMDEANMLTRHPGHAILDFMAGVGTVSGLHPIMTAKHLGRHLKRMFGGYRGGGGIFGGGGGGGGGSMATAAAIGALGLDAVTALALTGGLVAGTAYAGYKGMGPAAIALEARTRAGRIAGIPYTTVAGMYGGTRGNPNQISPGLAALGIGSPMQYADILSAYGMPYRASNAVNYAATASQAKYMGFMGAPQWAAFESRMMGTMGYGTGTMGIENMMKLFSDSLSKAVKGVVPPPQTFEDINKYLGMIASTGQMMPMSRAMKLATQGITSANPALRSELAQTSAGAAWSNMLGTIGGNPIAFTALMSSVYKATGSTRLNAANVNKTLRSLGLPAFRFSKGQAGVLNAMSANPVWAASMLSSLGITGELIPKSEYAAFLPAARSMGYKGAMAKYYAIGMTSMLTSGGPLARMGTLNYFGVRSGAPSTAVSPIAHIPGTRMYTDTGGFPFATSIMKGGKLVSMTMPGAPPSTISPYNLPSTLAGYREAGAAGVAAKLGASNIILEKFVNNIHDAASALEAFTNALSNWMLGGPISGPSGTIGRSGAFGSSVPYPLGGVGGGTAAPAVAPAAPYPPGVPALPGGVFPTR